MMQPAVAVAILALLALAGCLGGDDGRGPGPSATPSPTPTGSATMPTPPLPPGPVQTLDLLLAFEFVGCHGLSLSVSRPLDEVQALLPAGFTAVPAPDAANEAVGVVLLDLYRCGNLTTPAVSIPDTYIGLESTYVERPLERVPQAPDAPVQEYVFRLLAGEDQLADLWPAAGYDTYSGEASMDIVEDGRPALVGVGGVGANYNLVANGVGLDALGGARTQGFARYTVLGDASILLWTGAYELPAVATGSGTSEVAPDDPFIGFATPGHPTLEGTVRFVEGGNVRAQDLRRIFT